MAADFIVVNRSKQQGNSLVRAADLLREFRELIDKLVDGGNHCFNGSDYSLFEQQFGVATGQGANVLFLLNLVQTIFNTNGEVTGANRLSQLDEFCARLAGQ